LKSFR